jgi:hypothetical protein
VPRSSQALASRAEPVEGLEDIGQDDLIIPRLKIVQPTSQLGEGVLPGTFVSNLGGEGVKQVRIVPIAIKKGRVLFEEGQDLPTCKSNDGLVPSVEHPVAPACARLERGRLVTLCPRAAWMGRDADPPDCRLVYNVLALNLDEGASPFFISLKGTSCKPVKQLLSYLMMRKLSPFAMSCTMRLAETKNKLGRFYVIDFTDHRRVEPADLYREQWLALKAYDVERTFEAEVAAGADPDFSDADSDGKEPTAPHEAGHLF